MRVFFLACLLFVVGILQAEPLRVKVSAHAAILINAETGAVLYEKNADESVYPASLTKIATCLYALENVKEEIETVVKCPHECLRRMNKSVKEARHYKEPAYFLEPDGTHFWIQRGEALSFIELLYGMMLVSGNDAANYVAHYIGGNIPEFMRGLNEYLEKLGCHHTTFCNPHGLHHPEHRTTARDMALITQAALKNKRLCEIVSTKEYERSKTNLQGVRVFRHTNKLLKSGKFFYPRAMGMKSGYTSNAGYTFAAVAKDGKRTLIAIVMNCENTNQRYRDVIRLFESAFCEEEEERLLFKKEDNTFIRAIQGAKTPLNAVLYDDMRIAYFPSEERAIKIELNWEQITLPIRKGNWVGEMRILDLDDRLLKTAPLYASLSVEKAFWSSLLFFVQGKTEHSVPFRLILVLSLALGVSGILFFIFKYSRQK